MLKYAYSNSIKRHRETITLAVDALVWYYINSKGHYTTIKSFNAIAYISHY